MAITDKKTGVWGLDQTYNKINQGSIWDYSGLVGVYVWGDGQMGQLGLDGVFGLSSPVQIPGDWNIFESSGANGNIAMTKTDGTLWTWGRNSYGELGLNNRTQYSSPIQIPGTTWATGSASYLCAAATKTDGTLWTWGYNSYGQLGHNDRTTRSSPVQVPGSTWASVEPIYDEIIATKTDGTLWMWGRNQYGLLGQNNTTNYSSPVQVGSDTTWGYIHLSNFNAGAIKTDGTLWTWGRGSSGALGLNSQVQYSSPVQVGSDTTWPKDNRKFAIVDNGGAAVKTDGTLWSWGYGANGRLGQNNTTSYSSPVQIPGTTWSTVSSSYGLKMYATRTDGTGWGWGANQTAYGGFPLDIPGVNQSSPIQIPGNDWTYIRSTKRNTFSLLTK